MLQQTRSGDLPTSLVAASLSKESSADPTSGTVAPSVETVVLPQSASTSKRGSLCVPEPSRGSMTTLDVLNSPNASQKLQEAMRIMAPEGTKPDRTTSGENTSKNSKSVPTLDAQSADSAQKDGVKIVGVLSKWLNGINGYHDRYFVLDQVQGVLAYYKCRGTHKNSLSVDFSLNTQVIGKQAKNLEMKVRRNIDSKKTWTVQQAKSQGEVHLSVATFRASQVDHKKFYIHSGTKTLQLRAETVADRWSWLEALKCCKQLQVPGTLVDRSLTSEGEGQEGQAGGNAPASRPLPEFVTESLKEVRGWIQEVKCEEEDKAKLQARVEDRMLGLYHHSLQELILEREKRRTLLDYIRGLEDDKLLLESEVVGQLNRRQRVTSGAQAQALGDFLSDSNGGGVTDQPPQDSASSGEEEHIGVEDDDPREQSSEEFFDAFDFAHLQRLTTLATPPNGDGRPNATGAAQTSTQILARHDDMLNRTDSFNSSHSRLSSIDALRSSANECGSAAGSETGRYVPRDAEGTSSSREAPGGEVRAVYRTRLPEPVEEEKTISLWGLIKSMVGKDLTRICLPVYFNEPLSALQKVAEELEHSRLLDLAAQCPKGSKERCVQLSTFAVCGYSSSDGRTSKPFNPLARETYELDCPENGIRMLTEKVCHHPTVLAMHCRGRAWTMTGDCNLKSKFSGSCIQISPLGTMQVTFDDGETFTWHKVTTTMNNLIIGKLYVDHYGTMKVISSEGLVAKIRFKEQGFMDRNPHQVKGHVEDKAGNKLAYLNGKWDSCMFSQNEPQSAPECVWEAPAPPEDPTKYNLTSWAITLNEITPQLAAVLPKTDSRLRPDQRFLEQGRFSQANEEKQRLEEKQRAARKNQEAGQTQEPRWFRKKPGTSEGVDVQYEYVGGYWEMRESGEWENINDIFGK